MRNDHIRVNASEIGRARRSKGIGATVCGAQGRVAGKGEVEPGQAGVSKTSCSLELKCPGELQRDEVPGFQTLKSRRRWRTRRSVKPGGHCEHGASKFSVPFTRLADMRLPARNAQLICVTLVLETVA